MNNINVKRVIALQTAVNFQIKVKGQAEPELVECLENMCDSLNSHECELLMEWYSNQNHDEDEYVQMEIDFLREKEAEEAINAQWDY
jgi:hypothetical protein